MRIVNKKVIVNEREETSKSQKDDTIMKLVFWWACLVGVLLFELIVI
jgi:hypothetical protein